MRFKIKEKMKRVKCHHCNHMVSEKRYVVTDTKKAPQNIVSFPSKCEALNLVKHLERCPNEKCDFQRRKEEI